MSGRGQERDVVRIGLGERRTLTLAVPLPPEALPDGVWSAALSAALEADSSARLLRLVPAVELEDVAAELLARPRPSLSPSAPRLSWSALFVLGAAFAIALSRRRQPAIATVVALLACGSLFALTRRVSGPRISALRVLETRFDAPSDAAWLEVKAVFGRLDDADPGNSQIEIEPRRNPIVCSTDQQGRISIASPGASLLQLRAFDPGPRRLTRDVNAWGHFEEAWLRERDGKWLALGTWALGEALPAGVRGDPPGWMVPALPMGSTLFLGRLATGGASGKPGESPTWIRGLGL